MSYVGLDYGSHMLKAAECDAADDPPRLLNLGGQDPYLPSAVRAAAGGLPQCGWDAYRAQREALGEVAVGFRDRGVAKSGVVQIGKHALEPAVVHAGLLTTLKAAVQRAAPRMSAFALAVPDHWLSDRWALPVALGTVGWMPALIVREWNAAATQLAEDDGHPLLLVSLGTGAARATLAVKRGRAWERVISVHEDSVSGTVLRDLWRERLIERVVRACRRDPRETPHADQLLTDAMEAALRELHARPVATFRANLFGAEIGETASRDELRDLAAPMRSSLKRLVSQLVSDPLIGGRVQPRIAVWGELTTIVPAEDWLDEFRPDGWPVERLGLNAIAHGAAQLAAWWTASGQTPTAENSSGLCLQCGTFTAKWPGSGCPGCRTRLIPLGERLDDAPRAQPAQPEAVLTLIDEQGERQRQPIRQRWFRLGRSSLANWQFDDAQFPGVSSAHAVITWDGAGYRIRDLDSRNKTLVNGIVIDECALTSGDEIRLGEHGPRLLFELEADLDVSSKERNST